MSDTTFRTESAPAKPEVVPQPSTPAVSSTSTVEVPYLDYGKEHGAPFIVEHYKLGDTWSQAQGGFEKEVNTLESYFLNQIHSGELPNSVTAIKNRLKEIEKVTNTAKEERPAHKLGIIAAYVRFLSETDDIKHNIKRYGSQ